LRAGRNTPARADAAVEQIWDCHRQADQRACSHAKRHIED